MPRERFGLGHTFLARDELLAAAEIERVARLFVALGVNKVRLTGGEPLLRRDVVDIVERLGKLDVDLALTTNGLLLPRLAPQLAAAGLRRVSVSLDALDDATFRTMTDSRRAVSEVLAGIDAAAAAGLRPIKVNTVVRRGINDDGLVALADHFRHTPHRLRFIEYMDVGATNGWSSSDVVPGAEIVARLDARFGVEALPAAYAGEVATRYRYRDGGGEFGVITSISRPFCAHCSRARLAADGRLYGCLFATSGVDLRTVLRAGASDAELTAMISGWWSERQDRYSELRDQTGPAEPGRIEMSYVGG